MSTILTLAALCAFVRHGSAQDANQTNAPAAPKLGLSLNDARALAGYTLVFPLQSRMTYLIDNEGRVVHTWESRYSAGQEAYLLENGNLLRAANLGGNEAIFGGASQGGRIQEFTWDGELVWDYKFHNEKQIRHHAVTRMPNGNIMMIVWERKTAQECIEAGVNPEFAGDGEVLVDSLIEVQPEGKTGGRIVWEWHIWDHLVQDHDRSKANFGDVAEHSELIDANFARGGGFGFGNLARFAGPPRGDRERGDRGDRRERDDRRGNDEALQRLRGIGYVGSESGTRFQGMFPDWTHVNAVSYNAELDQIMISPREFNEIWIIDHSTTTEEAASHKGGRHGKGGDLLYRWGNPRAYRAGTEADQRLFSQHDAHWIPDGVPGAGHVLIFNNGGGRPDGRFSSVDEIALPVDADGNYQREDGTAFGPKEPGWSYTAKDPEEFFAPLMSGAQRLPNGNTLICAGFSGMVFEVTPEKETVWSFVVPADNQSGGGMFGPPGRGRGGFGPPRGFGPPDGAAASSVQLLPGPLRFFLQLSEEQSKQLDEFEKQASEQFDKLLSDEQRKQLKETREAAGPFGPPGGEPLELGRILSTSEQESLKLSNDQKESIEKLGQASKAELEKLLTEAQKEQIKQMEEMARSFAQGNGPNFGPPGGGPPGGGPNFGPPGRGRGIGRGGRGPGGGGPGGFMGGVPGGTGVFRAYRYAVDYPGLAGKDLAPGKTLVEMSAQPAENTGGADAEGGNDDRRDDRNN